MGKKPTWTDEELINALPKCTSFSEVATYMNMSRATNSLLKKRSIELNLNFSHFRNSGYNPLSLNEVLVKNKETSSHRLKKRLITEGLKQHKCECCGITEWMGKPTPIELDHINGNHHDNRLENLRILCPNCHAQTDTYRGKNKK
jgi:Zn finger protein HypA/HybF involved in hydrogenase expression